jgi:endoglucanase
MQKTSLATIIVTVMVLAGLLLSAPGRASAQDGFDGPVPPQIPGEVVYIPFPVDITVDGDLSDWQDIPSYTVDYGPTPSPDPAENGSFTFALAANADNLYITMQMPDQNIVAGQHNTDYWNEDSMEFYVNASGDLNASSYNDKIFQVNINATDIGNTDPEALKITGVNGKGHNVRGFVFKTDDGWGFEASVPLAGLVEPAHGTEIGFQAQINGATQSSRDVKLIWSKADTGDLSWQTPYLFGRGIFFELGREDIPQPSELEAPETPAPTPTPIPIPAQISVNQTGYFPLGEKIASLATGNTHPREWSLLDSSGQVVASGQARVMDQDTASGDKLQIIDFSDFQTPGRGYRLSVGQVQSVPFDISDDIYGQLKYDALAYFYHNRSGTPIEAQYVGEAWARPAGHITDDNVTCYKGSDPDGNIWPGCDYTLDVSGGWYDAGDFGKYVVNGGISVWTLLNLYERFPEAYPDGSLKIPENANGVPDLLDEARWEMEFLLSMQVPEGEPKAGMVHHKIHDRTWAAMPMVPPSEVDNDNQHQYDDSGRYLYPPSTAATLNLAATAAQCARIWKEIDPAFSQKCLSAAETAWQAAQANPSLYAGNTPGNGGGNYDDNNVKDEFYWAAAELFVTTGKEEYRTALLDSDSFPQVGSFDWGHTAPLGTISLAVVPNDLTEEQLAQVRQSLVDEADSLLAIQSRNGYAVPIDGDYPWGSNSLVLNNMIYMGLANDITSDGKYLDAMRQGMDYILGRNALNKSYVSGYGAYPMEHPHHRFWANLPDSGFPPPPPGVVAGGPNSNPSDPAAQNAGVTNLAPAKRYVDDIESFSTNEVTINWNAPLAWDVTFLDAKRDGVPPAAPTPEAAPAPAARPPFPIFFVIIIVGAALLAVVAFWLWRKKA